MIYQEHNVQDDSHWLIVDNPDSKVHGANMGPIWGRQAPGGPHVGPMNFAIWEDPFQQVHYKKHANFSYFKQYDLLVDIRHVELLELRLTHIKQYNI